MATSGRVALQGVEEAGLNRTSVGVPAELVGATLLGDTLVPVPATRQRRRGQGSRQLARAGLLAVMRFGVVGSVMVLPAPTLAADPCTNRPPPPKVTEGEASFCHGYIDSVDRVCATPSLPEGWLDSSLALK